MSVLQLSLFQMNVQWEEPTLNLGRVQDMLNALDGKKTILVLPELWSTCFSQKYLQSSLHLESLACLESIERWCRQNGNWCVAGSLPWRESPGLFNRCWIINDVGEREAYYDKIHLFSKMREETVFSLGKKPAIFSIKGVTCGVIICYDLRFPELYRCMALAGVELLFVVAQWPQKRIKAWDTLLRGCAVANQMYVVACNRSGESDCLYGGQSSVISPWGDTIASSGQEECLLHVDVVISEVRKARKRSPYIKDRRAEVYSLITEHTREKTLLRADY